MFVHCGHNRETNEWTQCWPVHKSGASSLSGLRVNKTLKLGFIPSNLNHFIEAAQIKKNLVTLCSVGRDGYLQYPYRLCMCQNMQVFNLGEIHLIPRDTSSHIWNILIFIPTYYSSIWRNPIWWPAYNTVASILWCYGKQLFLLIITWQMYLTWEMIMGLARTQAINSWPSNCPSSWLS